MEYVDKDVCQVNRHTVPASPMWDLIMNMLPEDTGGWDAVAGRQALSEAIEDFLTVIKATRAKFKWPGEAPSEKYSRSYSRSGYLTRNCPVTGLKELAYLVTMLVSTILPDDLEQRPLPALACRPTQEWSA